ncbi:hypothetical protein BLNAU_301 [Blattamonas nauphoetae]|uniref:Uncharacterized protein n=1 Tax=Blattamonas nauphoetae TaxID=2049346 RepID=A0ABQ9YMU1_9EUKA|nr:hypothetical protein BLNAU_301 [Blattamonas nauphoetae]
MAEFNREGYGTLFQHLLDHIAPEETVHTAHAQIRLNMLESELRSIDTDVSSLQTPTLLEEGQALEAQIRATNNELELVQTEILKQEEELSTIQRISSEIRQRRLLLIDVPSDRMAQTDWTNLSSDQASLRTIQLVCECDAAVSAYASSEMALLVDTIDKGMTILDQLEDVEAAIEVNAREDSESEQTMRETIKASSILAATVENTAQKLAQKLSHLNDHTIPTLQTSTKDERLDTFVGQLFLLSNEEDQTRIVPLPTNASDESTVETFLDTSSLLTELKEKLSRQRTQLSECARGFEEQPTIHEENIHKLVNRVRSGDEMLLTQWTPQVLSVCNSALQTADAFDKLTQTVDVWWKQPAQFALKDPVVDNLPLNDWIQKWKYLSHLLLSSQPQQNG